MSFFWSQRLGAGASPDLMYYYADLMKEPDFLVAVHGYDCAQVVMLSRSGLGSSAAIRDMAGALQRMGEVGVVECRRGLENAIHGGEEYLRAQCGPETASLLHIGRSSPSIRAVASRVAVRRRLLAVLVEVLHVRESILDLAATHVDTYMPGYSYLQHIDLTSLGYYLVSWAVALERDTRRLVDAYHETNVSVVGTDGGFGTPYRVGLEHLDALLGFPRACANGRDGIRNYDYLLECLASLAILHSTVARLATDLIVWSSSEFGFVRVPAQLSITSSVAPHMRIPYVLEFLSGMAAVSAGGLTEGLVAVKAPSEQLEAATLLPLKVLHGTAESQRALRVLAELVQGLEVDEDRLACVTSSSSATLNGVVGWLIGDMGVPYRAAHAAVAEFQRARDTDRGTGGRGQIDLDELTSAVSALVGRERGEVREEVVSRMQPGVVVASRNLRGGTAPVRVTESLGVARAALDRDRARVEAEIGHDERAARDLADGLARLAGDVG